MIYHDRLGVYPVRRTRGSVTNVSYRHVSVAERSKPVGSEHVVYKSRILIKIKKTVVVYDNSACFLTPMLQSKKTVIGQLSHILAF